MNDERQRRGTSDERAAQKKADKGAGLIAAAVFAWDVGRLVAGSLLRWINIGSGIGSGAGSGSLPAKYSESALPGQLSDPDESPGREADLNLTLERETNLVSRRRWGTLLAVCAFAASLAGGVGFLVCYWTGSSNQALGGSLAVFLGALGAALVLWAHLLTVHKEATEPRENMASPAPERKAASQDFCCGGREMQRRGLLKGLAAAVFGVVGAMAITLFRSLGFNPNNALYTTVWKSGQRLMNSDGDPVKVDTLPPGSTTVVFPEGSIGSETAQTVLIRVNQQLLQLPEDRAGWAPMGNLAFSRICTHAGCSVGMYLTTAHLLMCPCHQSTFDVLRAAQPTGGPAARPLPQLPLYVDSDGVLRAGGGFSEPPGPGFWGMPS